MAGCPKIQGREHLQKWPSKMNVSAINTCKTCPNLTFFGSNSLLVIHLPQQEKKLYYLIIFSACEGHLWRAFVPEYKDWPYGLSRLVWDPLEVSFSRFLAYYCHKAIRFHFNSVKKKNHWNLLASEYFFVGTSNFFPKICFEKKKSQPRVNGAN